MSKNEPTKSSVTIRMYKYSFCIMDCPNNT